MVKQDAQQAHALLSHYIKLYTGKYNRAPVINRFKEKWAMIDVIDSVGGARAKELLEYYFRTTNPGHPLQWFFYNFDRLHENEQKEAEDRRKRDKLRAETKARVEQFRRERGEFRGETDSSTMQE